MVPEASLSEQTTFKLEPLAQEILGEIVPQALEKDIHIELVCTESNLAMKGSKVAIGILIRNLVDNGIKYTPEGGSIIITIKQVDQQVMFEVADNGPGIPEDLKHRIFERFFRIIGSKATGSGLGLSIVRQIIEIHQARIEVNNREGEQTGLIVQVYFNHN